MPSLYSSLGCETGTDTVSKGSFPCDSVRNDSARSVLCGYKWLALIWFTAQVVNATCPAFNYIYSKSKSPVPRPRPQIVFLLLSARGTASAHIRQHVAAQHTFDIYN